MRFAKTPLLNCLRSAISLAELECLCSRTPHIDKASEAAASHCLTCEGVAEYAFLVYAVVSTATCFSNRSAPFATAILIESKLSGSSWVENPIEIWGYLFFSRSIWLIWRSPFTVGYCPTQCIIERSFCRFVKKLTTLSICSRVAPAVDAITGKSIAAIWFNNGQSVNEQLAILI